MSKAARRFQPHGKKPIDRIAHPKTGRRKGEKRRKWMPKVKV